MVPSTRPLWLWGPVVLYMAVIFLLSSLAAPPVPAGMTDVSGHFVGYMGLAVVVVRALARGVPARIRIRTASAALAITIGYAFTDEFHQMFVPGRFATLEDLQADGAGALLGVVACWAWGIIDRFVRPRDPF